MEPPLESAGGSILERQQQQQQQLWNGRTRAALKAAHSTRVVPPESCCCQVRPPPPYQHGSLARSTNRPNQLSPSLSPSFCTSTLPGGKRPVRLGLRPLHSGPLTPPRVARLLLAQRILIVHASRGSLGREGGRERDADGGCQCHSFLPSLFTSVDIIPILCLPPPSLARPMHQSTPFLFSVPCPNIDGGGEREREKRRGGAVTSYMA